MPDPYEPPSESSVDGGFFQLAVLHRRRRILVTGFLCLGLSVLSVVVGWMASGRVADARVAAGKSFDEIDQAYDYFFLGCFAAAVLLLVFLVSMVRWVWMWLGDAPLRLGDEA